MRHGRKSRRRWPNTPFNHLVADAHDNKRFNIGEQP